MNIMISSFRFLKRHLNIFTILIFLLYVGFLDSNSLWERHHVWKETANLKQEIAVYVERYSADSVQLEELKNNPRRLEQIARERYYMVRPNEDLFVIQNGNAGQHRVYEGLPIVKIEE